MFVSKYSASGNDFIIITQFHKGNYSQLAKKLCHRKFGIGADGLIVLLPGISTDLSWQFYNCDGSIASMCGNGARAAFLYAKNNRLIDKSEATLLTKAGVINGYIKDNIVKITLSKSDVLAKDNNYYLIDTGVKHYVKFVDDLSTFDDVKTIIKLRNKYDANVNYVSLLDGLLYVRTFEKGVESETLACGTGISASFYVMCLEKGIKSMKVVAKSGETLNLSYSNDTIYYEGLVTSVLNSYLP